MTEYDRDPRTTDYEWMLFCLSILEARKLLGLNTKGWSISEERFKVYD